MYKIIVRKCYLYLYIRIYLLIIPGKVGNDDDEKMFNVFNFFVLAWKAKCFVEIQMTQQK